MSELHYKKKSNFTTVIDTVVVNKIAIELAHFLTTLFSPWKCMHLLFHRDILFSPLLDQSELEPALVFRKRGLRRGLPFGLLSITN